VKREASIKNLVKRLPAGGPAQAGEAYFVKRLSWLKFLNQVSEHPCLVVKLLQQLIALFMNQIAKVGRNLHLRFEFGARTQSDIQELPIFPIVAAVEAFRRVRRD
jgi:hypothetical protein